MPHYSDEQARVVFDRDMSEVWPYYQRLADQNRPAVKRAIGNLTGQPSSDETDNRPAAEADEGDDVSEDLTPDVSAEGAFEGELPDDPPPTA